MSIKSAVRDGSFVKFLVGGVVLLVLAGGGVYLIKRSGLAIRQDENEIVGQLDESRVSYQPTTIATNDGQKNESSNGQGSSSTIPTTEAENGSSTNTGLSTTLPQTGPVTSLSKVFLTSVVVYGITYLSTNKRR